MGSVGETQSYSTCRFFSTYVPNNCTNGATRMRNVREVRGRVGGWGV